MSQPNSTYHVPVMLQECLDGLNIDPNGIYVDVTFGGGGHSRAILEQLGPNGKLFGVDQDPDAVKNTLRDDRFTLIEANFRFIQRFLRVHGVQQIDGLLGDLGVSSYQINTAEKGFSTRFDGPLDMRMNPEGPTTAADILNTYTADQLQHILGTYGEVRNAKTLAQAITAERQQNPFAEIQQLKALCEQFSKGNPMRYLAQVFQALRIEVNEEMQALEEMLLDATAVLKPGGRLVIMSYHSLEDRPVKNLIKNGCFDNEPVKDDFGRFEKLYKPINRKPITASAEELKLNKRARSAKLRVAEKV